MPVYKTAWYHIPEDCQHYCEDFRHCHCQNMFHFSCRWKGSNIEHCLSNCGMLATGPWAIVCWSWIFRKNYVFS